MNYIHPSLYSLRDAFEKLGGVAALNTDGEFVAISREFTGLFGYADTDVLNQPLKLLFVADGMPDFYHSMKQSIQTGELWMGEMLCQCKDGSPIWTRLTLAPSVNGGELSGFIALFQRVYVKAHNQLSEIFYRYRAGFNKVLALAVVSKRGIVQEINELFTQLYGYSRSDIIGRPISTLKSGQTKQDTYRNLWETILSSKMWSSEFENQRKDGTLIPVRATIAPASDTDEGGGIHDAYLVIYQDIGSEVTERATRLQLAVEAGRQEMMSGTLHNIGNLQQSVSTANAQSLQLIESLRTACGMATEHMKTIESIKDKEDFFRAAMQICLTTSEQVGEALQVEKSAIHETNLVLQFFRQQQRNITVSDKVNIPDFVQNILNTFVLQANRHGISLSISNMTKETEAQWPIDKVQQILFNLLKNAKEAISAHRQLLGPTVQYQGHICLSIDNDGADVIFQVTDNGGGFSVDPSSLFLQGFTTKVEGTGIGLHHSAIMAQSMHGTLTAENVNFQGNLGAQFLLRIPRYQESSVVNRARLH